MNPLKVYVSKVGTAVSAASAIFASLMFDSFAADVFSDSVWEFAPYIKALTIGLFVGAFVLLGEILAFVRVASSSGLRKRILGKRFIEGLWAEAMLQESNGVKTLRGIAIIAVTNKDENVQISGDTFLCDGSPDGSFTSKSSTYHNYVLDYTYLGSLLRTEDLPLGYGTIIFGEQIKSAPISFSGRYNGEELSGKVSSVNLRGLKISDDQHIKDWEEGTGRTDIVKHYADYYMARFPDYTPDPPVSNCSVSPDATSK